MNTGTLLTKSLPWLSSELYKVITNRLIHVLVLLFGLATNNVAQTSTNDFGTGTASFSTASSASTTTIPNPSDGTGTTYVRIGSTGGSVNIQNPGYNGLGCGSELRAVAPTSASIVKATPFRNFATASPQGYVKFNLLLGTSTGAATASSGIWSFYYGDGAMYADANNFSGAQVFAGLRFTFGASGAITTEYRNGGSWTSISSGITQGNLYTIELMMNNTASTINYTYGSAQTVAANRMDFWVNGTLIGNDISKAAMPNTSNMNDLCFIGESSTGNVANIFVDDMMVYNAIPSTVTRPSVAISSTTVAAANVPVGTNDLILQQYTFAATGADATFNSLSVTTAGTYISADITNLKVRYSTDNVLSAGDATLATLTTPGAAGVKTFTPFTCQTITSGTTGYIFVTADVASGATVGNNINITSTAFALIGFSEGAKTGTSPIAAGGVQTFASACTDVGITSATAGSSPICSNTTTSLTANGVVGTNAVVTWWSSSGGTGTNYGTGSTLSNAAPGTYYARVTGDCGSPVESSVTVGSTTIPSTSSITGNISPACNATGIAYSVTLTSGSSYAWTVPSGASITAGASGPNNNAITVSFSNQDGDVTVTETNAAGCVGTQQTLAITLTGCGLNADFTSDITNVCSGSDVVFTNASTNTTGSTTYSWNFGANASPTTATGEGPHTVTYTGSGSSTVSLTATDGSSDTETKSNLISILDLPTANAGAATPTICQGATTTALGGSFGGSATSAIWSDGGAGGTFANNTGSTPATTTYTANVSAPSSVTLTLTTSGGSCGTTSANKTLTVNSIPSSPTANGGTTPQLGSVFTNSFTANWNSISGATGYYLDVATTSSFTLPATIANEPFENTLSIFSETSGTGAYYNGSSGSGDRPATSPFSSVGTYGYGITNGSVIITSNDINTSLYTTAQMSFRLAAFSYTSTGNGMDAGDIVTVEISPDGGTNFYSTVRVLGNSNAYWAYSATGNASTVYDGNISPVDFAPASGGSRTTDGYSTVTVTGLPISSNLKVRITILNNNANERWVVDDLNVTGTGSSYVPGYENLSVAGTTQSVSGLATESTYYYRVRAYNSCGTSSNSNVVQVTTTCSAPVTNASTPVFSAIGTTSMNLAWTNGSGAKRLVLARAGAAPTSIPVGNVTYGANADITLAPALGNGFVVYNGTASNVTVTGLTPGTQYYFIVFEYNCNAGTEQYLVTSPLNAIQYTYPSNVTLSEGCTDNATHQLNWTFGAGANTGVIIFARASATPSGPGVSDASTYSANTDYSLATDLGAKGRVVYMGTGTSATITGLTAGINYTFAAYTYVNNTSTVWSSGTTVSQTIALTEVVNAAATGDDGFVNVGWTNPGVGCYDEIMVVANAGAVVFTPTGDGTAYTANSVYAGSNQVVYKGTGIGVTVTALTNGTNYCFRIFVRKGTQWSVGTEVCAVPSTVTSFGPGDLAIVAINTQVLGSGSTDEICFVAFRDINPGTSFYMTDNGYERANAGAWGETEGVVRFTRLSTASVIPAGTVICIDGPYTSDPRYDIVVCGVNDNANWQFDPNVIGAGVTSFDLNSTDQVWITQGGFWTNPSGSQNANYDGNVLYGWTGITWKDNIGTSAPTWTTAGSRLIPGTECFTTDMSTVSNNSKSKYTGPVTDATRLQWITRINDPSNWTGYTTNTNYDNAGVDYDYVFSCITWGVTTATESDGVWTGAQNDDWFNCSNWETLTVPDSTVNVLIQNVSGANNSCNIDNTSAFADLYGNIAKCLDLTIDDKELRLTGDANDILYVYDDLTITDDGTLDMSDGTSATDGTIHLHGDWSNQIESNFKEGDGLILMKGSATQNISTADTFEKFNDLTIENTSSSGVILSDSIEVKSDLRFVTGIIDGVTNSKSIFVSNNASTSVQRTGTGHMHGSLRRAIATGTNSYLFPIGGASIYAPATLSVNSVTVAGSVIGNTTAPDHVQLTNSALDDTKSVNRTWTFSQSGLTFSTYDIVMNYNASDLDGAANFASLLPGLYSGTWTYPTVGTRTSTSIQATGLMGFGALAAAECRTPNTYSVSGGGSYCSGGSGVTINLSGSDNWVTYELYNNGIATGTTLSGTGSAISFGSVSTAGSYTIHAVNQFSSSCNAIMSGSAAVVIINNVTPTVSISSTVGSSFCAGTSVTFTALPQFGGTSPTYQWKVNGSDVGAGLVTYNTSSLTDGDIVSVVMTSNESCTTSAVVTSNSITVNVEPYLTATVSISGSYSVCSGSEISLTAVPMNGGVSPTYVWKVNGVDSGTGDSFSSYTVNNGDAVTVQMTSNVACPVSATVNSSPITVTVISSPDVDAGSDISLCSITPFVLSVGAGVANASSYSWTENGAGSITSGGSTLTPTYTPTSADAGNVITFTLTANGVSPCTVAIDEVLVDMSALLNYYIDFDADGFGDPLSSPIASCTPVAGRVADNTDCCDSNASINPSTEWWADLDGDGIGSFIYMSGCDFGCTPPAQTVAYNPNLFGGLAYISDCNDNNPNVSPALAEVCGNTIDDNCNGTVNEACAAAIGDTPFNATVISYSSNLVYPACLVKNASCDGAADSPESVSFTGPDVWYRFTAYSTAVSITMNGNVMNNAIGLYSRSGSVFTELSAENVNPAGVGGFERLNYNGLSIGVDYYISFGAVSGSTGGDFSFCLQHLFASGCAKASPPSGFNLCESYKAIYRGASSYTFNFTGTGGTAPLVTTSATTNNGIVTLSTPLLQLRHGGVYDVKVDVTYNLLNGAGTTESFTVLGSSSSLNCSGVSIMSQPLIEVKSNYWCPVSSLRNSYVKYGPVSGGLSVCGASGFTYECTPVADCAGTSPGTAITINTSSSGGFLNLMQLPSTGYWSLRVRPNFPSGNGTYGPSRIINVVNSLGMTMDDGEFVEFDESKTVTQPKIFPNPGNVEETMILWSGLSQGMMSIEVYDELGRRCLSESLAHDDSVYFGFDHSYKFTSGIYFIHLKTGDRIEVLKWIVEE